MIAQPVLDTDELYVVSDLHLGGQPGMQIFGAAAEFVQLAEHLKARATQTRVALVINGDFVDFLAEAEPGQPLAYFDPQRAAAKLERIHADAAFAPVFAALQALLAQPKARLAVTLGNHDLELALPWVREKLVDLLAGEQSEARARLRVDTDGAGLLCQVGPARVLCLHGNEVDDWNSVDHGELARKARALVQGQAFQPWVPNGGSKMVIDIVNELKRQHFHFVDLLKPEGFAVLNFLLALGAGLADKLGDLQTARRLANRHRAKAARGELGAPEAPRQSGATPSAWAAPAGASPRDAGAKQLLARRSLHLANRQFEQGVQPMDLLSEGMPSDAQLDADLKTLVQTLAGAFRGLARGEDEAGILREALKYLVHDRSFDLDGPDDSFDALEQRVGPDIDILVAGHTHLERALPRRGGRGMYYNTGTWARLIQIRREQLQPDRFEAEVYQPIVQRSLDALDRAGLASQRCSVAVVRRAGRDATAHLARWCGGGGAAGLEPLDHSSYTRKA